MSTRSERDQGSERTKPPIVSIGEEFHPYVLQQEDYYGFPPDDLRSYKHPRATTVTLHTGVLPDLDFQIITILPEAGAVKNEIIVESSIAQVLQLGLIHKTGRRASILPSWQPYGFNEDILPLVQRLRFSFIASESESEAEPEVRRTGQIQFKFHGNESELTPELRARFDLTEDPIETSIKTSAMGDPEEERRLRESVKQNLTLRDFFLNGPTSLSTPSPKFDLGTLSSTERKDPNQNPGSVSLTSSSPDFGAAKREKAPIRPTPRSIEDLQQHEYEQYLAVPGWRIWSISIFSSEKYERAFNQAAKKPLAIRIYHDRLGYQEVWDRREVNRRAKTPIFFRGSGSFDRPSFLLEPLTEEEVKIIDEHGEAPGPIGSKDKSNELFQSSDLRDVLEPPKKTK